MTSDTPGGYARGFSRLFWLARWNSAKNKRIFLVRPQGVSRILKKEGVSALPLSGNVHLVLGHQRVIDCCVTFVFLEIPISARTFNNTAAVLPGVCPRSMLPANVITDR